jgi:hypothetical protein
MLCAVAQGEECEAVFGDQTSWGNGRQQCERFEGYTMRELVAAAAQYPWCIPNTAPEPAVNALTSMHFDQLTKGLARQICARGMRNADVTASLYAGIRADPKLSQLQPSLSLPLLADEVEMLTGPRRETRTPELPP